MLDEMPDRERRDGYEPGIGPEPRQEHEERDEDERVPAEMDPLDVQRSDDPLSARAGQMQHVDLHHLGDVLEEMRGLADREESEEKGPGRRDKPVGIRRRPDPHRQSTTPAKRRTSSMMSSESLRTSRTASVIVATSMRPPRSTGSTPERPASTRSAAALPKRVARSRSSASATPVTAVSKPMQQSVSERSLSTVFGTPITRTRCS